MTDNTLFTLYVVDKTIGRELFLVIKFSDL